MAQITGDSPEAVAFALLEQMVESQNWTKNIPGGKVVWTLTPNELLDRYYQCLKCVKGEAIYKSLQITQSTQSP
jgi:hypothetical protein